MAVEYNLYRPGTRPLFFRLPRGVGCTPGTGQAAAFRPPRHAQTVRNLRTPGHDITICNQKPYQPPILKTSGNTFGSHNMYCANFGQILPLCR